VSATGGGCEAYCDCAVDAGKPATDAAPADAGDAGEDGSDADGGAASDGGVSSSEPPESCGTITCAPGCGCADRSLSKCRCAADACLH